MTEQKSFGIKIISDYSALFAFILAQWWLVVSLSKLISVTSPNEVGGAMLLVVFAMSIASILAVLGWCTTKFLDEFFHRIGADDLHNWIVLYGSIPVFVISALDLTDRLHLIEKQQFLLAGVYAFQAGAVTYIYRKFWHSR